MGYFFLARTLSIAGAPLDTAHVAKFARPTHPPSPASLPAAYSILLPVVTRRHFRPLPFFSPYLCPILPSAPILAPLPVLPMRHFYHFRLPAGFTILQPMPSIISALSCSPVLSFLPLGSSTRFPISPSGHFAPCRIYRVPFTVIGRAPFFCDPASPSILPFPPLRAPIPVYPFYRLGHFNSRTAIAAPPS